MCATAACLMTDEGEFVGNGFDCPSDVFIQAWMTRLENRRIVFSSADEEVCRVDLANVEDGMYSNFNWGAYADTVSYGDVVMKGPQLVPTEFSHPADSLCIGERSECEDTCTTQVKGTCG